MSTLQVCKGTQRILVSHVHVSGELLPYLAALVSDISTLFPSNINNIRMFYYSPFYLDSPQCLSSSFVEDSDINHLLTARSPNWQRFVCPKLEDLVIKGLTPSATALTAGLRPTLQTRQTRLKSLEVTCIGQRKEYRATCHRGAGSEDDSAGRSGGLR